MAGLVVVGGAGDALAQGFANMGSSGNRSKATRAPRDNAARPPQPRMKGSSYRPAPRVKGYSYRPGMKAFSYGGPTLKGHAYGPVRTGARRPHRAYRPIYYRTAAPRTCGEFHYWSPEKGRCLNARTNPPDLSK